jgi:hypothetical protein
MLRRRMRMAVPGECIAQMFKAYDPGLWMRISSGVPADATVVRLWYDQPDDTLHVIFEHPSFPETRVGDPLPWHGQPDWEARRDGEWDEGGPTLVVGGPHNGRA